MWWHKSCVRDHAGMSENTQYERVSRDNDEIVVGVSVVAQVM